MIQKQGAFVAPRENTDACLKGLGGTGNSCSFQEAGAYVILFIDLYDEESPSLDDVWPTLLQHSQEVQETFRRIDRPWLRRILLEDGQTVLSVQSTDQTQNMLLQEKHASFRHKNGAEAFIGEEH